MTNKDVLPDKDLLGKAAGLKRFGYSLLHKELKAQTTVAEKEYQGLNKLFESDKYQ